MKTLTLKLTAPLQSYGNEATFDRRTSYHCPSKSAVLGMIAAALGYRRDDPRIPELNQLAFAVRVDQPGQPLTDFQIVEYQKSKTKFARKLTYRDYLQDAVFMVALGGDDDEIDRIEWALHHPKFQLYLGRRANPPAGVLNTQLFDQQTPVEVLKRLSWQASQWYQRQHRWENEYSVELFADATLLPNKPNTLVKDAIGSFSQEHRFSKYRAVVKVRVELTNPKYVEAKDTGHNIYDFLGKED
ncbi:type I-E CRISPR-associated protein Cas5/CasD [[Lactobacillus] timonensis]|uniref:type I-E CRISPR-associated protein Cas5/CasD n=1 Tax=[Lactobacillus] timonensis TaxID=1970790 RepID=UPI000C851964|nr:type I-E CRISPR-associated protein Cas5/CasD [[Lactobacillus] timonensis]